MSASVVFLGPTLEPWRARERWPQASYLPPARQGDVYRAALTRPRAIGIVDGYFEGVPAVWHKEILWAMRQGVWVFGSASMGALRAAELCHFGMIGVGEVFADYCNGRLQDDDEVAIVHGPAEFGYRPLSEALVNIRASLVRAAAAGVIDAGLQKALLKIGKSLFYKKRTYQTLLAQAAKNGLPEARLEALRAWLGAHRFDQKRADAEAMLRAMRDHLANDDRPMRAAYHFEHTEAWQQAVDSIGSGLECDQQALLLDELRLSGRYPALRRQALLRMLAQQRLAAQAPSAGHKAALRQRLRAEFGLYTRTDWEAWLAANRLGDGALERLLENEARLERLEALAETQLGGYIIDCLRISGEYREFYDRAEAKRSVLESGDGAAESTGANEFAWVAWYFNQRNQKVPEDIEDYACAQGFADSATFYRALRREYHYAKQRPCR